MPYGVQKRPRSREAIEALIRLVAAEQNTEYPEHLIAETFGVRATAVERWKDRGVPMVHWPRFAELAGVPVSALWAAHRVVRRRWERDGSTMVQVSSKRLTAPKV